MGKTKIAWTEETWNPVTGCSKLSAGCRNCYAATLAERLNRMGNPKYADGFRVTLHPTALEEPMKWRKPRVVFVCSMSDLFHDSVPDEFIDEVFRVMRSCPLHTFQVLTKRARRMEEYSTTREWPSNVWAGVTVESDDYCDRAESLRTVDAPVRFISAEPLLASLTGLDLSGVDWVVAGGESGQGWRPMDPSWARDLRDRCTTRGIPFFFKQHAGFHPDKTNPMLDGIRWAEMPSSATRGGRL